MTHDEDRPCLFIGGPADGEIRVIQGQPMTVMMHELMPGTVSGLGQIGVQQRPYRREPICNRSAGLVLYVDDRLTTSDAIERLVGSYIQLAEIGRKT